MAKAPRDIERIYSTAEVVAKLRRLADALENGHSFRIQIAGERVRVPTRGSRGRWVTPPPTTIMMRRRSRWSRRAGPGRAT